MTRFKLSRTIQWTTTALLCFLSSTETLTADEKRPLGDSKVFASVPFPGYPEGIAIRAGRVYVSGPANFGVPGNFVPSTIFVYDLHTSNLVDTITIQNQPGPLKAISCIKFGEGNDLFVADESSASILRINVKSKVQTTYAGPFYPVFASAYNPPAPFLINDLAFDKKGYLYVTDSFQATIWRVPPGGGAPQPWFTNAAIDGVFGPNGVAVDHKSEKLYFTRTLTGTGGGYVYTLPLIDQPSLSDLQLFHTYPPGQAPDGIAFGKSGSLYVAMAGSNQISVLDENGNLIRTFSGPAGALPWANPANIAFDNTERRILVTNHASLTGLPDPSFLFAVFDVYVNDKAGKTYGDNNN